MGLPSFRRCHAHGRTLEVDFVHSGQRRGPGHADVQEPEMTGSPMKRWQLPSQLLPEMSVASTSRQLVAASADALSRGRPAGPARKRLTAASAVRARSPETS